MILREPCYDRPLDNPYLYGMPVLFPVNRIEGGRFEFEGREYRFPINEPETGCLLHGILHAAPFELAERGEDFLLCRFSAEAGEYMGFAHAFSVEMRYSLSEQGLSHEIAVKNLSGENMPVFIGFHTTFNSRFLPGAENVRVCVPTAREFERDMKSYLPTGKNPEPDGVTLELARGEFDPLSRPISRHYEGSGDMSITDIDAGASVVYESSENLSYRLIYNGGGAGFICLEPQSCMANCQNAPEPRESFGFDYIASGCEKHYKTRIYLKKA